MLSYLAVVYFSFDFNVQYCFVFLIIPFSQMQLCGNSVIVSTFFSMQRGFANGSNDGEANKRTVGMHEGIFVKVDVFQQVQPNYFGSRRLSPSKGSFKIVTKFVATFLSTLFNDTNVIQGFCFSTNFQLTCGSHGSIEARQVESRLTHNSSHFGVCVGHSRWDGQRGENVHFAPPDLFPPRCRGEAWVHPRGRCYADDVWERGGPHRHNIFVLTV